MSFEECVGHLPVAASGDLGDSDLGVVVADPTGYAAEFLGLKSHHLLESHFCRVRRLNEKGHVEPPEIPQMTGKNPQRERVEAEYSAVMRGVCSW